MPRVSKNRELSSDKKYLFLDDFYSAVTSLKDKREVKAFFEDLLTWEEKLMLAKRFQIAMMHHLNYIWKEIGERIKVTETTIAKVRQKLDYGKGGLKEISRRILAFKEKKLTELTSRKGKEFLGPAIVKSGLAILIQKHKKRKKAHSIFS